MISATSIWSRAAVEKRLIWQRRLIALLKHSTAATGGQRSKHQKNRWSRSTGLYHVTTVVYLESNVLFVYLHKSSLSSTLSRRAVGLHSIIDCCAGLIAPQQTEGRKACRQRGANGGSGEPVNKYFGHLADLPLEDTWQPRGKMMLRYLAYWVSPRGDRIVCRPCQHRELAA